MSIGTFRSDGDVNENTSKGIGLICTTTALREQHAFLSLFFSPSLHDYNVKMSNFTFYGGRKQSKTKFFFTFSLRNSTPGEFAYIWQKSELEQSQWRLPFQATFSLPSPSSDQKVPNIGVGLYALRVEEDTRAFRPSPSVPQPFFADLLKIVTVFRDSGFVVL